jgi:hypothetical protein
LSFKLNACNGMVCKCKACRAMHEIVICVRVRRHVRIMHVLVMHTIVWIGRVTHYKGNTCNVKAYKGKSMHTM